MRQLQTNFENTKDERNTKKKTSKSDRWLTIHANPSTWKQMENALICFSPNKPATTAELMKFVSSHSKWHS